MPNIISCPPWSAEVTRFIAGRFRVLGNLSRLKLILAAQTGQRSVSQLVAATGLNQSNASRHLQILTNEGVLTRRKVGLHVYYSAANTTVYELCQLVLEQMPERLAL